MSNQIQAITDDSFEQEVIEANLPVLVDFWAQWCGPCKALSPVLEDVAQKYLDKVKVVKMDVDQNPSTPAKFNVRAIPTLILFKGGQVLVNHTGMLNKTELAQFLDKHI